MNTLSTDPTHSLAPSGWHASPTLRETMLLCLLTATLFVSTIVLFRKFPDAVSNFGDSNAYTGVASAIRHWDFHGLQIKQFWGYPYAMAMVSLITRIPDQGSLLVVSFA